ncbi:hypothetical protein WME95_12580 [Sorangium sp. So ce327]|uniref:hypothetical protein n=1 Tax=Sorangium sp. So ce327 TaxID=3133301 RepID=UPI003F616A96
MTLQKTGSRPRAGGPILLRLGWPHDPAKNLGSWPHEAANWHLGLWCCLLAFACGEGEQGNDGGSGGSSSKGGTGGSGQGGTIAAGGESCGGVEFCDPRAAYCSEGECVALGDGSEGSTCLTFSCKEGLRCDIPEGQCDGSGADLVCVPAFCP